MPMDTFQPQFHTAGNNNMADVRTCEVEETLAPLNTGSWNYVS